MSTSRLQRSDVRFLVAENLNRTEILSRMLVQYGKSLIHRVNIYKWVDRLEGASVRK